MNLNKSIIKCESFADCNFAQEFIFNNTDILWLRTEESMTDSRRIIYFYKYPIYLIIDGLDMLTWASSTESQEMENLINSDNYKQVSCEVLKRKEKLNRLKQKNP